MKSMCRLKQIQHRFKKLPRTERLQKLWQSLLVCFSCFLFLTWSSAQSRFPQQNIVKNQKCIRAGCGPYGWVSVHLYSTRVCFRLLKQGIQRSLQEDFCPDIPTNGIIRTGIAGELLKNNVYGMQHSCACNTCKFGSCGTELNKIFVDSRKFHWYATVDGLTFLFIRSSI